MPITKSAKKALRQNIKRRAANLKKRKVLKDIIKNYRKLVLAKKFEDAKKTISQVFRALDKAAKTNLIKKGKARRLKSRLSKLLSVNLKK